MPRTPLFHFFYYSNAYDHNHLCLSGKIFDYFDLKKTTADELLSHYWRGKQFRRGHRLEKLYDAKTLTRERQMRNLDLSDSSHQALVRYVGYVRLSLIIGFILARLNLWKHATQISSENKTNIGQFTVKRPAGGWFRQYFLLRSALA